MKRFLASIEVVLRPVPPPEPPEPPEPPPTDLVFTVEIAPSVTITGLGKASVAFKVKSPAGAPATRFVGTPTIVKTGAWKDNVSVALRFDNFEVPAGGEAENFLDIETVQAPLVEERVAVSVGMEVA